MTIQSILIEISQLPATLGHQQIIISLLVFMCVALIGIFLRMMWLMKKKTTEVKAMQLQQHVAKIDAIRKDHSDTLERIRVEMLKKEEERIRQWVESEKETLHVLNGVSMLLDLNEKIGRVESEKILSKLDEIRKKIEKITAPE
jgi:oligoendopeptidase F